MKPFMGYFNEKTGEIDYLDEPPADWRDYLPQVQAAQGLYECHLAAGLSPAEAAKEVLLIATGNKE